MSILTAFEIYYYVSVYSRARNCEFMINLRCIHVIHFPILIRIFHLLKAQCQYMNITTVWINVAWGRHVATYNCVIFSTGSDLLLVGNKPWPESMLTYHQKVPKDINLGGILCEVTQPSITEMSLKVTYPQTSDIRACRRCPFTTEHLDPMDWTKTSAICEEKHSSFVIPWGLY